MVEAEWYDGLTARNHDLAVAIASVPDDIRGYGHIKQAAMAEAATARTKLWSGWPEGRLPTPTTTLIAAE